MSMVSKGSGKVVLWPRYFNAKLSRAAGRRVPASLAVREPDAKWVESAAKKAGFDTELEPDVSDPRVPYRTAGRVLVAKKGAKESIVQAVAKKMQD